MWSNTTRFCKSDKIFSDCCLWCCGAVEFISSFKNCLDALWSPVRNFLKMRLICEMCYPAEVTIPNVREDIPEILPYCYAKCIALRLLLYRDLILGLTKVTLLYWHLSGVVQVSLCLRQTPEYPRLLVCREGVVITHIPVTPE